MGRKTKASAATADHPVSTGAAEVAAVAVFLASDDASHVHGATIPVDAGMTAVRGFI